MRNRVSAAIVGLLVAASTGAAAQTLQCPDHVKATRSNGTSYVYRGHDPVDAWVCVGDVSGERQDWSKPGG